MRQRGDSSIYCLYIVVSLLAQKWCKKQYVVLATLVLTELIQH